MGKPADLIDEAVRRIVREAGPVQVIVFGSATRGNTGPDSDLDFLVVVPNGEDRVEIAHRVHRAMRGLDCAVDIVIVSEREVAATKDNPSLIVHTALTEGKEVYHAA